MTQADSTGSHPAVSLTSRQREVLELVGLGYSNAEIAEMLGISISGVRVHCDVLRRKLCVDRRRLLPLGLKRMRERAGHAEPAG